MRKNYIPPESRLFAINLSEKIASSMSHEGDIYSTIVNGKRVYIGVEGAEVITALQDGQYITEIMTYALKLNNWDLLKCVG